MASPTPFPYAPGGSGGQDNLTGLAAGQAKVLGQLGTNQVPLYDIVVAPMQFVTGASATGTIEVFVCCSEVGGQTGNWTGGIDPTSNTDQSAKISPGITRAGVINVQQGATTYKLNEFSVFVTLLGFMPMFTCILVWNNTTAAFNATSSNFIAQYSLLNYTGPAPISYG